MGVKDQEPVVGREKEIQRYLQRMERVLTQAERMHSSTHVQPARRRHSLSNSQESLKAIIGSAPNDASLPSSPDAPLASRGHTFPPQNPDGAVLAQDSGQSGKPSASPQRQPRRKLLGTDPRDLMRQTAHDSGGLLDTSATLADWIMRSTSSSAGASQRESDEAAELTAEVAASPAGVAYSSLVLESLSEWALKPDNPGSNKNAPGPFPRQRSPVSFPVALSESASISRATSSPLRPPRVSHAGRPSASLTKTAASACATSDTEDTADSGSPRDQQESSGDSKLQPSWKPLLKGEGPANRQQTAKPATFGSNESAIASAARPEHRRSPGKPGASSQDPSPRSHGENRVRAESGSPGIAISGDVQPAAAYSAKPRRGLSDAIELDARRQACAGRSESAAEPQQVPALQKLKLRVRSRHRSSSQGTDLPMAFQDLQLTDGQLLPAAHTAVQVATASAQDAPAKGIDSCTQDGERSAAGRARSATAGMEAVPAEEQLVFRASRTLPRSPLRGTSQPSAQVPLITSPIRPAKADTASKCDTPPHTVGSPAGHAQLECTPRPLMPAGTTGMGVGGARADLSPSQRCSSSTPSPQQQPESPPGSGVLAVNSLVIPAVRKAQRSGTAEESAIFTPSHKLARSPRRQPDPLMTLQKDSGGQLSPCSFPQDLEAEDLPETPRMRTAARTPPDADTHTSIEEVDSPANREENIAAVQQRRASTGAGDETQAAGLPMLDSDQPTQAGHAEQQEAASEISPRYAGAALSRLPRPPRATSPRPASKRPQSGGASKLPSAPAGPFTAQSRQPTKGSASHSRKAAQRADQALSGCAAQPVLASRRPEETQRSHFEVPLAANISPGRRRNVGDTAPFAAKGRSPKESMPNTAVSGFALISEERTPDKDRRRSSARGAGTDSASPVRRPKTSPAAADAEEGRLSGHLRVVQSLSGSPPEKPAMKRRLSLGAPQRIRSPAQPALEAPGSYGTITSAAKSGSAEAARTKGAESPTRPRLQGSHVPERSAQVPSRLQGAAAGARKSRTRASAGRDTVLSAVGKLPIDVIMGSMHGALMD